jgi:hypothetical protein
MRFSIKGQGQIKRSLETSDRFEAERKAEEIWFEANYRARQGLSAKARTFEQAASAACQASGTDPKPSARRGRASACSVPASHEVGVY